MPPDAAILGPLKAGRKRFDGNLLRFDDLNSRFRRDVSNFEEVNRSEK
jgi:hypothetical protein